jgi:probable rRNA maturation factor
VVDVRTRGIRRAIDPRTIARRATKLLGLLDLRFTELSVMLCDDATITELNRDYRGLDKPTDVLSFPLDDAPFAGSGARRMLGDVVISVETARVQAARRGYPLLEELTSLLVHGLLHLAGFDHQDDADAQRMERRSAELMSEIAVGRRARGA